MLNTHTETLVLGEKGVYLVPNVVVSKIIIILGNIYKRNCSVIVTLSDLHRKTLISTGSPSAY